MGLSSSICSTERTNALRDETSQLGFRIRDQQSKRSILVGRRQNEDLRLHARHPPRGEVEDAHHLPVHQVLGCVVGLRRGDRLARTKRAEVDLQPERRLTRFGQFSDVDDPSHAHVERLEVLYGRHLAR